MDNLLDLLQQATITLTQSGAIKDRLAEAYAAHLIQIDADDLPEHLRGDFTALCDAMRRERPLPRESAIHLDILRDRSTAFHGETSLKELKRRPEELVEYLYRDNVFPYGCFLLTGTGIVPPDDFTLQVDDEIRITIDPIGTLVNHVVQG